MFSAHFGSFLPFSLNLKLSSANSFSLEASKFVVWERVKATAVIKYLHQHRAPFYTPAKRMFFGPCWNQPACPSVNVSISVQTDSFCQCAGRGIKSHLVTALVFMPHVHVKPLCCVHLSYFVACYLSQSLSQKNTVPL